MTRFEANPMISKKAIFLNEFKKSIQGSFAEIKLFSTVFLEWVLISSVIGVLGGLIGSAFSVSISGVTALRAEYPWLLYLLPAGGLLITVLYRITKTEGTGTNDIIDSILFGKNVPIILLPVIFVSTVITHLCGGSAGREGAALQIGGSLGCTVGKIALLDEKEERIAIMSGMSAVFSALFGTPVTATVFALEVCSVGILHYSGLVPCGIASVVAFGITRLFGIVPTHFALPVFPAAPGLMVRICILAALCAVLSVCFCKTMHFSSHTAEKLVKNPYFRAFIGGVLILLMTFAVGSRDYNGGGTDIIALAIEQGKTKPAAFLLKILFTAVTIGCGFKGGEIVPTFFIGSAFGCVLGPVLGIPAELAAAIGLAATFCGAVNCPVATVFLSVEIFGAGDLLYFAAACFISYMLSGYTSLYPEQKIMYSKLKAEYINRKAE